MTVAKNTICLWYDKDAEAAARYYAKTFPNSKVGAVHRAPSDFPSGRKGDVLTVEFTVAGVNCIGLNGGPAFKQTEAFSFQIATDDQEETDRYWNAIVGNGGQESACGWCKDRWGVSWQITPRVLIDALAEQDIGLTQLVDDLLGGVFSLRHGPGFLSMLSLRTQHLDQKFRVGSVGGVAGGAAGGAVATKSAKGAFWGGVSGGAFAGVDAGFGGQYSAGRVVADATVGGASAAAQGGEFWQGFGLSATSAGAEYGYREIVQWSDGQEHPSEWGPGHGSVEKRINDKPVFGVNNTGTQASAGVWSEGRFLSRVSNRIPGVNAVAGMHDHFQIQLSDGAFRSYVVNVPGMAVAAGITYPALMRGPPSVWVATEP